MTYFLEFHPKALKEWDKLDYTIKTDKFSEIADFLGSSRTTVSKTVRKEMRR